MTRYINTCRKREQAEELIRAMDDRDAYAIATPNIQMLIGVPVNITEAGLSDKGEITEEQKICVSEMTYEKLGLLNDELIALEQRLKAKGIRIVHKVFDLDSLLLITKESHAKIEWIAPPDKEYK